MVTLSGNCSAIVRSPIPKETQEAYEIRAATEEIAGRTAAPVLKGYTAGLQNELAAMRKAVARGDLDACAEHDVKFHRSILKASQNDVLLRVWDTLGFDLRIRAAIGRVSRDLPEVIESHQPIVDALEKGCEREAGLLLRNHVETVLEYLTRVESDRGFHQAPRRDLPPVDGYSVPRHSVQTYRGGLGPARLRRVTGLVHAKIEGGLSLDEMAESVGLSTAHFSQMFRSRQARAHTGMSCARGWSVPSRCCVRPKRVSWMSRWRAASRRSSTLHECFAACAAPVLLNIATSFWVRRGAGSNDPGLPIPCSCVLSSRIARDSVPRNSSGHTQSPPVVYCEKNQWHCDTDLHTEVVHVRGHHDLEPCARTPNGVRCPVLSLSWAAPFHRMSRAGQYSGAENAVQTCWVRASRNPPKFEHEGAFRSWLLRI